jgi:hypothetical protein
MKPISIVVIVIGIAVIVIAILISCPSEGVESHLNGSVYSYQGIYLKKIKIYGDRIYFPCDSLGNIIGASISTNYKSGKHTVRSSVVEFNPNLKQ